MERENMNPMNGSSVIPLNAREGELLTGDELCQKLKIKKSFLYAPTRRKGPDAIPCVRVGKYLRYEFQTVREWIERQTRAQIMRG